ncbi:hypothetical protein NBRC116583_03180 [Arenicella sp. 4NH20-0111]|uniref:hypothetical protein n=1 Tax=Arenicella sp. 4NH20-0111 TaxID=3127648 RepID=UPI00310B669B
MSTGAEALQKVREAGLTKEFTKDPVGTLEKAGVDTNALRIHQTSAAEGATHSACASVGCGVCASVG